MKTIQLTNLKLKKPHLLISCYETTFDYYFMIQEKKERLEICLPELRTLDSIIQAKTRIKNYKQQLAGISENLRNLDGQIHNYIATHQS